jgi:predicted amidophosphoribosyltransferase
MDHIRIWSEVDLAEIQNHIITVDDKFGFCPGCREMGIKLEGLKACPKCGREFKYVTAHDSKGPKGFEMVGRIRKKLPHLAFVDYDDYERISGKKKAESLFNV